MSNYSLPLFPLHTVLYPGGRLPLRIFEPRYTDMIGKCVKNDVSFGVCLIREGKETGNAAQVHEVGTTAKVVDWHMRKEGLLGVVVVGDNRFNILSQSVASNQLLSAEVEFFENEDMLEVPIELMNLVDLLEQRLDEVKLSEQATQENLRNATWVGFRLAELLPLKLTQKQYFLQLNEPILRLERINDVLQHIDEYE